MNPTADTFEAYLDAIPPERREGTLRIMQLLRTWLPGADERVQWGIAILSRGGRDVAGISARKGFYSLYAPNAALVEKHLPALGTGDCGKGCIRFKTLDDLNEAALRALVLDLEKAAIR